MGNVFKNVKNLPARFAIFDLDGCVFDDEWRISLIKPVGHPDRFRDYHEALLKDATLPHGSERLKKHLDMGDGIAFLTARPESVRQQTVDLIRTCFNIPFPNDQLCLFMRRQNEEGIDSVTLKERMILNVTAHMTGRHKIVAAYDDRPDIIEMYLRIGIDGARILDKNGLRAFGQGEFTALAWQEDRRPVPALSPEEEAWKAIPETVLKPSTEKAITTAADILTAAAETFRARNAVYKDNADNVGKVMAALFPNGVAIKTAADHKTYHLFELIIVKLTRFANSGLTHQDSIRDAAVYSAMVENLVDTHQINIEGN